MKLIFEGKISLGDSYRVSYCEHEPKHERETECIQRNGSVWIGTHDVVGEVGDAKWAGPVACAIFSGVLTGEMAFVGALRIAEGWGYSEYTPMDPDQLFVGPHDLIKILAELAGTEAVVWFADEPINVLAGK